MFFAPSKIVMSAAESAAAKAIDAAAAEKMRVFVVMAKDRFWREARICGAFHENLISPPRVFKRKTRTKAPV